MSRHAGLLEAARLARHQAAICRGAYEGEQARTLAAFASTLEKMADEEGTDPMALRLVRCTHCSMPTPSSWDPPRG